EPRVVDGHLLGRGVVDDKGPLVQALLAMRTLADSPRPRSYTLRLLVGSDEETEGADMKAYLATHAAPDLSLVLDASFPVVVGEPAVPAVARGALRRARARGVARLPALGGGRPSNPVRDEARATLVGGAGPAALEAVDRRLRARTMPEGTRLDTERAGDALTV